MKWARGVILGTLLFAACAESVGTPSEEDDFDSGVLPRIDAGKRDSAADGADGSDEVDADLFDAGKKDTGVKDTGSDVKTDAPIVDAGTDTKTDTGPVDSSFPDVFVDAGPASTTLVINEVDYDQPGTDDDEFIEILNKSGGDISLADYELILFNGGNSGVSTSYLTLPLGSGTLGSGQYLLVKASVLDAGASVTLTLTTGLQNGPRDSVAIRKTSTGAIVDAISYGENGTPVSSTDPLVEGFQTQAFDSNTIEGSLIREPNGTDTNDNRADFKFTKTPTPGAANVYTP